MRTRRIKAGSDESAVYHCITRTVNGAFLFEDADREMLRRMLWKVADFSGVQILTYCLLSNHFHVLVRVPVRAHVPDDELIRRHRVLYPKGTKSPRPFLGDDPPQVVENILRGGGTSAEMLRRSLLARMGDLSEFMKTLKQRFSVWYNRTHDRYGTLWAERFKSVLVENDAYALTTVAAYIDLNGVRAGLVEDPKDYRFCGYGEAIGEGSNRIRTGLTFVAGCRDWTTTLREYRMILFGKASMPKRDGSEAGQVSRAETQKTLNEGGHLPLSTVLRCRVRYFTDGAVLGSSGYVTDVLRRYQELTGRRSRQTGARPMEGTDWGPLTTLRGLRRAVFG